MHGFTSIVYFFTVERDVFKSRGITDEHTWSRTQRNRKKGINRFVYWRWKCVISWYHVINNDLGVIEMLEPYFFSLSYDFRNWKLITEIAGQGCNSSNSQNCLSSALHGLEPHEPTKYFCRGPCTYSTAMVGFHHQAVVVWNIQEISLCSGKSICLSIAFPL